MYEPLSARVGHIHDPPNRSGVQESVLSMAASVASRVRPYSSSNTFWPRGRRYPTETARSCVQKLDSVMAWAPYPYATWLSVAKSSMPLRTGYFWTEKVKATCVQTLSGTPAAVTKLPGVDPKQHAASPLLTISCVSAIV
eukprot:1883988-Rhodomonas_salina.1